MSATTAPAQLCPVRKCQRANVPGVEPHRTSLAAHGGLKGHYRCRNCGTKWTKVFASDDLFTGLDDTGHAA